ncbi:hypothetical protein D910_01422, partial [Dendroctonus ponderosae]
MDVTCSTSSIFNLVAISIDRYIAVTKPIKYAKHKNSRRIWLTIAIVWGISAAIGSPIVLGLNNTSDRISDACLFFNSDFIIFSSLSSFYIPCIIMVFLYYSIFKALKTRAMQQRAVRKPLPSEIKAGSVIENLANTRRLAETHLGPTPIEEQATNTGSGSGDDDDEILDAECQVISNDRSTEFILATVVEEAASDPRYETMSEIGSVSSHFRISSVVASLATPNNLGDPNGNNDSGYAHSQAESIAPDSPRPFGGHRLPSKRNGAMDNTEL